MDYAAEQEMELEALEAILMNDLTRKLAVQLTVVLNLAGRTLSFDSPLSSLLIAHKSLHGTGLQGPPPEGWPPDTACRCVSISTADEAEPASANLPDCKPQFDQIAPRESGARCSLPLCV